MKCEELFEILLTDKPSQFIKDKEEEIFCLIPDLFKCKGFNQNNSWHIYDVYEHILHVIDGVPNILELRLASLFHDIGKPYVYTEDENGIGHFYNHWVKSCEIFISFARQYGLDYNLKETVTKLIFYHDLNFGKLSNEERIKLVDLFTIEELRMLFSLKRSDLLAQNSDYHNLLISYDEQEEDILKKCRVRTNN